MHLFAERSRYAAAAALLLVLAAAACRRADRVDRPFARVIGSHGRTSGRFNRPRGIVYHAAEAAVFVIDRDGRIQKFAEDGEFRASWRMPVIEKGTPEDLCVAANGNLLVADTHCSRIAEFTPEGLWVRAFGSYGTGPGQFVYPVGICQDGEGFIYVCEYGGNDRVQKFTREGTFVGAWGRFGTAPGEFQRPAGMAASADGRILVADAVNHRVQIFDGEGALLGVIGGEGTAPGRFRYPYDVAARGTTLYVLEYGNQRVQKLAADGRPLDMLGQPGRGDGRFASPWRFALAKDSLFVSDTDNSRVVELPGEF